MEVSLESGLVGSFVQLNSNDKIMEAGSPGSPGANPGER